MTMVKVKREELKAIVSSEIADVFDRLNKNLPHNKTEQQINSNWAHDMRHFGGTQASMYSILKQIISLKVDEMVTEAIDQESLIDTLVERINKKQLK